MIAVTFAIAAAAYAPHTGALQLGSARPALARASVPLACESEKRGSGNIFEDAWQRYVLIRPGMDFDELRDTTKLRTARAWSWDDRTPGTGRTIFLTSAVVTLFAIPVLLTNPTVLSYLIEFAALSRTGVTPQEYFANIAGSEDLGSNLVGAFGELGRLIADLIEWMFTEKPAY